MLNVVLIVTKNFTLDSFILLQVVITNELTTRVTGNDWNICPALGDSHEHKINQRIILSKCNEKNYYVALMEKSNIVPQVAIPFVVICRL